MLVNILLTILKLVKIRTLISKFAVSIASIESVAMHSLSVPLSVLSNKLLSFFPLDSIVRKKDSVVWLSAHWTTQDIREIYLLIFPSNEAFHAEEVVTALENSNFILACINSLIADSTLEFFLHDLNRVREFAFLSSPAISSNKVLAN